MCSPPRVRISWTTSLLDVEEETLNGYQYKSKTIQASVITNLILFIVMSIAFLVTLGNRQPYNGLTFAEASGMACGLLGIAISA